MQQGVGVLFGRAHIDLIIIAVDEKPGSARGEAGVGPVVPLHGAAGIFAAPLLDNGKHLLLRQKPGKNAGRVEGHHVLVHIQLRQAQIGHADLLPLVDEGRALLQHVHGGQHFPALHPVFLAAVAADNARVVVVFDVQGVPAPALQLVLPLAEGLFHLEKVERPADHIRHKAVGLHVGEGDHLVEHLVRSLRHVAQGSVRVGGGAFAHDEAVVLAQNIVFEFLEIPVGLGAVGIVLEPVCRRDLRIRARQPRGFGDEGDHVLPEAVHPHVQPEAEDALDLIAHSGVAHIQIRLLFGEQMQVVFVQIAVVLPGLPLEERGPVVGRLLLSAAARFAGAPVIIIVVGVIAAFAALDEPGVLIRAMVDHKVHKHAQAPVVGFLQHALENREVAEVRVDVHIVGDVVTPVGIGRGVEGREPDRVHPQALDIIQTVEHAVEIADPVAVSVAEAAGPDMVDHHILVPGSKRHGLTLLAACFLYCNTDLFDCQ